MDEFQRHEKLLASIVLFNVIGLAFINSPSYLHRYLQRRIWADGLVHVG